jgi:hypothetical protein
MDSFSNLIVNPPLKETPSYASQTRPTFEISPMSETFDPSPQSIPGILKPNGAVLGGRKVKSENNPLAKETVSATEKEQRFNMSESSNRAERGASSPTPAQGNKTVEAVKKQEERVYLGATYVKGEDGKWHLKK